MSEASLNVGDALKGCLGLKAAPSWAKRHLPGLLATVAARSRACPLRGSTCPGYGWAKTSERLSDTVTKGNEGKVSLIAAVSTQGLDIQRCFCFDGVGDGSAFSTYLERVLVPSLKPGSVVVMDDFSVHHSKQARHTLERAGCTLVYLPTYSPDLNPTELVLAKVKAFLRRAGAQTPMPSKKPFQSGPSPGAGSHGSEQAR